MKKLILLGMIATASLCFGDADCEPGEPCCSGCIVEGRIPKDNMRYDTFVQALDLIKERNLQTLVETGTSRSGLEWCASDGCSTIIFSDYLEEFSGTLYSVDINREAITKAQSVLIEEEAESDIVFIESDSITFLEEFNHPIDFLYLDSYDFECGNPEPSQQHHLREIEAAYPHLHENSVVMIDDCELPHGGKGKYVIPFLLERGWRVIANKYQVLLVRS